MPTLSKPWLRATLLFHPKPDAPTCIMSDASNVTIGAILQHFMDGQWYPISLSSDQLKPVTAPLTMNCWQYTYPLSTSDTLWRDVIFM